MTQLTILEKLSLQEFDDLVQQIISNLSQGQGFRLGESTVVSHYIHKPNRSRPGEINILVNRDAGQELAQEKLPSRVIHVDVFHEPARVEIFPLARVLEETIKAYQTRRQTASQDYAERIFLETGTGSGNLRELLEHAGNKISARGRNRNHVHILLKNFLQNEFDLIPCLVDTIETELARQGVEIRKVESIFHVEKKGRQTLPVYFMGFNPDQHNLWQLATALTSILSSPEDVVEFLQAFQPGLFRRKQTITNLRNKHGNLRELLIAMVDAGLLKRGVVADTLTRKGIELLNFVIQHQRELESQMRKILRSVSVPRSKYLSVRNTHVKAKDKRYTYISKTTAPMKDSWLGSIAVPETLVQAAKHKILEKRSTITIKREDIRVHEQEVSKPVDVCLIIDGSASMAGPKMKAVWQLAEHLLLTTRDKVAVVVFQEKRGRVVIPFTRNYTRLKHALRSIHPKGMTPLADGITEAIKLIKNRHVRNPLLILITDGVPTFGKWTINPRQDALKAADGLLETRAKVICIGVASNREFLEELAEHARANLYIVDNLEDRAALIEIVRKERKY
ncbi:MAG TPA: VWA domain-containing protein [Syntrophomonadaceae bacterium]|nr:VWA domain-containing protein [Syntrophomonadaceae bacterium]